MRIVIFKVDEYLYEKLTAYAINTNTNRSVVVRNALEVFLKKGEIDAIPETPSSKRIPITFKAEEELLVRLDKLAIKYRLSRSEVIRIAVSQYLKDKEEVVPQAKVEKFFPLR